MWSIGLIVAELVIRVPFLQGESDMDQLKKTFHAMGSPTEQDWPVSSLSVYELTSRTTLCCQTTSR